MITVEDCPRSVPTDRHRYPFWNSCIHEISDGRAPQVVNKKPRIFIPRMTVFLLGLDQCSRSLSASCTRLLPLVAQIRIRENFPVFGLTSRSIMTN